MKYVIDIDGIICIDIGPVVGRKQYSERIKFINQLYDEGHEIIYLTSRGMNSTDDDPIASDIKYREITENQLKEWNAKYHKLMFGKPNADVYIDDKNILQQDFFK